MGLCYVSEATKWLALSIAVVARFQGSTIGPAFGGAGQADIPLQEDYPPPALTSLLHLIHVSSVQKNAVVVFHGNKSSKLFPPSKTAKNESGMARTKATARRRPTAKAIDLDIGLDGWLGPLDPW